MVLFLVVSCSGGKYNSEVSIDKAIQIATNAAQKKQYNVQKADIEILKVKKKLERGPIRLVLLINLLPFPKEKLNLLFEKEFWIVYFYPKGNLERPHILGGDYLVIVDLYSGEVLAEFEGK